MNEDYKIKNIDNTEENIEIPKDLYNFLLSNLDKVSSLYEEIGSLKESIGYFKGQFELINSSQLKLSSDKSTKYEVQDKVVVDDEKLEDVIEKDDVLFVNTTSDINVPEQSEIIDTKKEELKVKDKNQQINSSLRKTGFWIFLVSSLTMFLNLWIRNFVILQNELFNLIGIYSPIAFGGIITVLRPKGPGLFGWLILLGTTTAFILNYFEIIVIKFFKNITNLLI